MCPNCGAKLTCGCNSCRKYRNKPEDFYYLTFDDIGEFQFCEKCGHTLHCDQWLDIEWGINKKELNMFKKSDLKSGMRVKYRNGKVRVVIGEYLVGNDGWTYLNYYDNNLKETTGDISLDIVVVYPKSKGGRFKTYIRDLGDPIWEEPKRVRLTIKDIAKLAGCDSKDIEIVD